MNYYYLISGLPDLHINDERMQMSYAQVADEILSGVSASDQKLLQLYCLKHDNANLLRLLKGKKEALEEGGLYTETELKLLITEVKRLGADAETELPAYMKDFLVLFLASANAQDKGVSANDGSATTGLYPESQLSNLYFMQALHTSNKIINRWFEFNLNVGNILTAATCRRLSMPIDRYIIGQNEVAQALRNNTQKDWGLSNELEYFNQLMLIADNSDILKKEHDLDMLRWNWLEDTTAFCYFSVERLFCFIAQLDIIGRWKSLNAEQGEKKLRDMIAKLKSEVK